jgi:hypothetical protein
MPFNIGDGAAYIGNSLTNNAFIRGFIKNPFYTGILITIIIVLIILIVFRNIDFSGEDDTLSTLALRVGVYSLFVVTAIQFLQNQYVINEMREVRQSRTVHDVFKDLSRGTNVIGGAPNPGYNGASTNGASTHGDRSTNVDRSTNGDRSTHGAYDADQRNVPLGVDVSFL